MKVDIKCRVCSNTFRGNMNSQAKACLVCRKSPGYNCVKEHKKIMLNLRDTINNKLIASKLISSCGRYRFVVSTTDISLGNSISRLNNFDLYETYLELIIQELKVDLASIREMKNG